jgi:CRP-like cAMP-binding protein
MESDVSRMIVGLRRKGWMLGATALLVGMPYPATAETVTRSKLCFIPVETFKQAMEMNARFSRWVSVILSREVNCGTLNISEKGCLSGRRRLEKFLWDTIHDQTGCHPEKAIKILLPLKFWEIAQLIALTPEHLCRLFKKMETEGIVLKKNGWLLIPEPKKLYHPDVPSHVYSQQTW